MSGGPCDSVRQMRRHRRLKTPLWVLRRRSEAQAQPPSLTRHRGTYVPASGLRLALLHGSWKPPSSSTLASMNAVNRSPDRPIKEQSTVCNQSRRFYTRRSASIWRPCWTAPTQRNSTCPSMWPAVALRAMARFSTYEMEDPAIARRATADDQTLPRWRGPFLGDPRSETRQATAPTRLRVLRY